MMTHRADGNLWMALFVLGSIGYAHAAAQTDTWRQTIDRAEQLQNEQKFAEARTQLRNALQEASRHPRDEFRIAYTLDSLGSVAQDLGQYLDAQKYYRSSLVHWEQSGERGRVAMARTLNNLATLMQSSGKLREAGRLLLRSERLEEWNRNADDPETAVLLRNRGVLYLHQRNYRKAEEFYRRAAAILARHPQARPREVALVDRDLGFICEKTGRKKEAVSYYESAKRTWEQLLAPGSAALENYLDLAAVYASLGQPEQARKTLETAISQSNLTSNPDTPAKIDLLKLYAQVLRRSARRADAGRIEAQAREAHGLSQAGLVRKTVDLSELRPPQPSR